MPNFEESASRKGSSYNNDYSYSKILAFVNGSSDTSPMGRSNRVNVVFKDTDSYNRNLREMDQDQYKQSAGCDLSAIFMPFQTKGGVSGSLPGFNRTIPTKDLSQINIHRLLPFEYASGVNTIIKDKYLSPSGDSINGLVTSDQFYSDVNRYRDQDDIRGIGLRLPLMGVGWGFTTTGEPWPSGTPSGNLFFKDNSREGYQVDPSDYTAAPIDFRYDKVRSVWTTEQQGFWAQLITSRWVNRPTILGGAAINPNASTSGLAWSWREAQQGASGIFSAKSSGRFGSLTTQGLPSGMGPAFDANNLQYVPTVNSTNVVWIYPPERQDEVFFNWQVITGGSRYQVLMTLDDSRRVGWDFPRFH